MTNVAKIIEIIGSSEKGWEEPAQSRKWSESHVPKIQEQQ